MEKVVCVSSAKVPIVKMWDPELGLACDLNVNNTLALENTRMIKTYVEIDSRVRPLAMIIKHWTRRRIINDAGGFDSKAALDVGEKGTNTHC
jgi:DNA polymerase sigma